MNVHPHRPATFVLKVIVIGNDNVRTPAPPCYVCATANCLYDYRYGLYRYGPCAGGGSVVGGFVAPNSVPPGPY